MPSSPWQLHLQTLNTANPLEACGRNFVVATRKGTSYVLSWWAQCGIIPRGSQCTSWGGVLYLSASRQNTLGKCSFRFSAGLCCPLALHPFWAPDFIRWHWRFPSLPHKMMHTQKSHVSTLSHVRHALSSRNLDQLNCLVKFSHLSISTVCVCVHICVCFQCIYLFLYLHGYKFTHLAFMQVCAQLCKGHRLTPAFSPVTLHLVSLRQHLYLGVH